MPSCDLHATRNQAAFIRFSATVRVGFQVSAAIGQEGKGGALFILKDFIVGNSDVQFENCAASGGRAQSRAAGFRLTNEAIRMFIGFPTSASVPDHVLFSHCFVAAFEWRAPKTFGLRAP